MQDDKEETRNLLLMSLSEGVRREITSAAEIIHLDLRERIYEANQVIEHVDFPEIGVMSIVQQCENNRELEVITVGYEGMVGVTVALNVPFVSQRAYCQVEGRSLRVKRADFLNLLEKNEELKTMCLRYAATMLDQMAFNLVCNNSHDIHHRCAKWLLFTHDRMHHNQFVITQEFLAIMLGCSRTGVNAAAGKLAERGIIKYARGKMTVLDRPGLEASSCSCYKVSSNYYSRVLTAVGLA